MTLNVTKLNISWLGFLVVLLNKSEPLFLWDECFERESLLKTKEIERI